MDEKTLKLTEEIEKSLHKKIDSERLLLEEIKEVADYTASRLMNQVMVPFTIENRDFIAVVSYKQDGLVKVIELVARERKLIATPSETLIRANLVFDSAYSLKDNLNAAVTAILGHITGHIKPEEI